MDENVVSVRLVASRAEILFRFRLVRCSYSGWSDGKNQNSRCRWRE